ncbi:MAG: ribosome recycling factor [Clostridia bacterium]|nr:ribosome recycling factor [Clostridia bacterium]
MDINDLDKTTEQKMDKTIDSLNSNYASVRVGRANPQVLDRITAEYYGTPTPINQLAAIAVTEARTLTITPWDKTVLKPIEKAIQASELGINPQNDGSVIRLTFPPLTEERRKALSKEAEKTAEEARIAIRQIRRDMIDAVKAMKKNGDITEDDQKDADKTVQKITDDYIKKIDAIADKKKAEIMEI